VLKTGSEKPVFVDKPVSNRFGMKLRNRFFHRAYIPLS
jgi:hypothetical protein